MGLTRRRVLPLVAHIFTPGNLKAMQLDLKNCPIQIAGEWPDAPASAVSSVLARARQACLSDVALKSELQPNCLRVENHLTGLPSMWLHKTPEMTAWIMTDVGPRDWCKLAYQFGHELGHVICNSWQQNAAPRPPMQWFEELIAESFSLRGLNMLAADWANNPPFRGDEGFSNAIRKYSNNLICKYQKLSKIDDRNHFAAWHSEKRTLLAAETGLGLEKAAVPFVSSMFINEPRLMSDLGALNRWDARSSLCLSKYMEAWQRSCREIGTSGRLAFAFTEMLLAK